MITTFDDLLQKRLTLVEEAAVEPHLYNTEDGPAFAALVDALMDDLAEGVESHLLHDGAVMVAKELISRYTLPEGSGAAFEGGFATYSEVDSLNPEDAQVEAPVLEVEIRKPPSK